MEFSDLELIESMYRTSERARRQAAPDRQRTEYIALRDQYKPVSVKHVVVAEFAAGLWAVFLQTRAPQRAAVRGAGETDWS